MDIKYLPVISSIDLEEAINLQYGIEVDIYDLLFYSDPYGGRYRKYEFCIAEEHLKDALNYPSMYTEEDLEHFRLAHLITNYLVDIFPNYTEVMIDLDY